MCSKGKLWLWAEVGRDVAKKANGPSERGGLRALNNENRPRANAYAMARGIGLETTPNGEQGQELLDHKAVRRGVKAVRL